MSLADQLRGTVIPAVPVPFDSDGEIDRELHDEYVRWMAKQPIGGVAVWSHTGRGLHLRPEQLLYVMESWRAVPDVPIVCGVGVPHWAQLPANEFSRTDAAIGVAAEMAAQAKRCGASAVMVHPPGDLLATADWAERVIQLHEAVCEVGLPVIAFYLYEAAGGLPYTSECIEQILHMDNVMGIKVATLDSVMTFQDIAAVVARVPGALLITGEDRFLGYSMAMGAEAALVGLAAACTDCTVHLVESWTARETSEFVEATRAIDAFAMSTFIYPLEGYIQRMLWALEIDGVLSRPAVDPFGPRLDPAERDRVAGAVGALRGG